MKLEDMRARLLSEFPGRYVCFTIDIRKHRAVFENLPETSEIEISIYDHIHGHILCQDFEDGVRKLHDLIAGPQRSNMEIL